MDNTKLLSQIGELIDTKLQPIKEQLGVANNKISSVETKVDTIDMKVELVNKRIEQAQEETIETLSELITSGHNMHEKRIKRIEDNLQLPPAQ